MRPYFGLDSWDLFIAGCRNCRTPAGRKFCLARDPYPRKNKLTWKWEEKVFQNLLKVSFNFVKKNCIFRREKHQWFVKFAFVNDVSFFFWQLNRYREWPNFILPYSYVMLVVPGRIELKGTTSQKLAQLQEREIELLEEREKQCKVIEQLKEDRAHYRSVADDLR